MILSKRVKFGVVSTILSLGFSFMLFFEDVNRIYAILALGVVTLILFFWALREGIRADATLLTLILPVAFSLGVGFFWFLLPIGVAARIPVIFIYFAGLYILCQTSNIYTVSVIKTIALLRAAKGVGFAITLFTSFLLFDTILSLRQPMYINFFLAALVSYPLFLQNFWIMRLERHISRKIVIYSAVLSLIVAEIAMLLHFWPVKVVIGSMFLTTLMYELLGLGQARLEGKLFTKTVQEYLLIGAVVLITMFVATSWG